mgnify:CR=1 FL=1
MKPVADAYTQQMEQRYVSGNARWAIEPNGAVWRHSQYGRHWQFVGHYDIGSYENNELLEEFTPTDFVLTSRAPR